MEQQAVYDCALIVAVDELDWSNGDLEQAQYCKR